MSVRQFIHYLFRERPMCLKLICCFFQFLICQYEVYGQCTGVYSYTNSCNAVSFTSVPQANPPDIDTYFWEFGDGNTDTTQNPVYTYLLSGTYTVCLTITTVDTFGTILMGTQCCENIIMEPPPQLICLITVDSTSTKNVIVWEKPITTTIDSFRIYRDIIGTYTHIGSVAYSDLSFFVDTSNGINPTITSYRYKISLLDSSCNDSLLSDYHKTIHLQTSLGIPPAINLSWDDYIGFTFTYYRILRDTAGLGNWEVVDSVSSGILSWTDANPPQAPNLRYLIEVVAPSVCVTGKQKNWNSSKSNTSTSVTSINEYSSTNNQLKVYPNPSTGDFIIEFLVPNKVDNLQIKIINTIGQTIYLEELKQFTGSYQKSIDMKDYAKGIYELQLISDRETINKKIILQK